MFFNKHSNLLFKINVRIILRNIYNLCALISYGNLLWKCVLGKGYFSFIKQYPLSYRVYFTLM